MVLGKYETCNLGSSIYNNRIVTNYKMFKILNVNRLLLITNLIFKLS